GTSTTFTPGSIVFADASGNYTQDNASFFWDNSNNRLGVGTASPGAHLDIRRSGTGEIAYFLDSSLNGVIYGTEASLGYLTSASSGTALGFGINGGTDAIRIATTGNVGIGTVGATARLHLPAGTATASTAPLKFTSGTNLTTAEAGAVEYDGTQLYFSPSNSDRNILLQNATATAFTTGSVLFATTSGYVAEDNSSLFWDASSNYLGIGTATPASPLDIYTNQNIQLYLRSTGSVSYNQIQTTDTGYNSTADGFTFGVNGADAYFYNRENARIYFGTNDTARMNLNANGNFRIGDSGTASALLHIKAGDGSANFAPLKLTTGTNMATPEAGAFEFSSSTLYFTPASIRNQIALIAGETQTASGSLMFADASGNLTSDTTSLFFDNTNNRLGLGTTSPTANFQVTQPTAGTGTVTITGGAPTTVTGSGTQFTNTFKVGDTITVTTTSGSETKTISVITSDTDITVSVAFSGTASGSSYTLAGGDRLIVKGNGNIGIRESNPTAYLQITGQTLYDYLLRVKNTTGDTMLEIRSDINTSEGVLSKWGYMTTNAGVFDIAGAGTRLRNYGLLINTAGMIQSDSNTGGGILMANFMTDSAKYYSNTGAVPSAVFEIYSTTQGFLPPRLSTGQRDAIASPATGLFLYNASTNVPNFYDGSGWLAFSKQTLTLSDASGSIVFVDASGNFAGDNTNFFWNDASNNLGIGTNVPSYRLDVRADASSTYSANFFNDGNNDNRYGIVIQAGADTPSAGKWIQFNDGDGGDVGSICYTGGQANVCAPSDERLKNNNPITDTTIGLTDLMSIKVRDFYYNANPENLVHGFVAQELYESYPDAVFAPTNPNEYWKVSYSQLTPLIVKSIQDLNIKVEGVASLDLENQNSVASLVKTFLADIDNSLEVVFFGEVRTKKLCLSGDDEAEEDVCVTREELKKLKELLGGTISDGSNGGGSGGGSGSSDGSGVVDGGDASGNSGTDGSDASGIDVSGGDDSSSGDDVTVDEGTGGSLPPVTGDGDVNVPSDPVNSDASSLSSSEPQP
ncbi:MAG: tail fiber domain-containing protein, partial [Candidatus Paceibacterota bacterium]